MSMDFTELVDLASERLGGAVLAANDEFFAPKENLLKTSAPVFIEGNYTDLGKWMDGWETRRKRGENLKQAFDWCVIRLGLPGLIRGVVVDTSHFRGNFPSHCSIDACAVDGWPDVNLLASDAAGWVEVLPKAELQGDTRNQFAVRHAERVTHLRLKIYPDGGVARLRVYGEVVPDWPRLVRRASEIDLAAVEHGGLVIAASDMFFGHRHNLIMPGRALNMSDGWETKRRRGPGYDWCVVRLGRRGVIQRVEVDTSWFKGNFPESCSIEAYDAGEGESDGRYGTGSGSDRVLVNSHLAEHPVATAPGTVPTAEWKEILPRTKLHAHTRHFFEDEVVGIGPATHVRFNIHPDGGVSRLRVFGRIGGEAEAS